MRISGRPPTYCSSCHGQYTDRTYVDFDAYWDGPVMEEPNQVKVAIDDLIICDECLGAAATLLGYVNNKGMIKENYELGQAVEQKNSQIERQKRIITDLEHTVNNLLEGNEDITRPSGYRPKVRIPDHNETGMKVA